MRKMLLITVLSLTAVLIAGCTAAQLGTATKDIGGTPLQPYAVNVAPASQPAVYVTVQPTTQQAAAQLGSTVTAEGAAIAPAFGPWGAVASSVLLVISGILGLYANKQTNKAQTISTMVAQAAPGVAQLVAQATDNKTLQSDITKISEVAQPVLSLLATVPANHATAAVTAATAAASPVQAVATAPVAGA